MNRYLDIAKIRALLLENNSSDEEVTGGKKDNDEKNISDHVVDSEIEIDEEDELFDLDVDPESFEDHDKDDEYVMEARSTIKTFLLRFKAFWPNTNHIKQSS